MPKGCCVLKCPNYSFCKPEVKKKQLQFHRLPCEEPRRSTWCRLIGLRDPGSNLMRVCSEHFDAERDYSHIQSVLRECGRVPKALRLKPGTVPTLRLPSPHEQERLAKRQTTSGDDPVWANEALGESAPHQKCCCCIPRKAGAVTTYRCVQERPATHIALRVDRQGKAAMKDASVQASAQTQQAATNIQGSLLGRRAVGTQVNFQHVYAAKTCAVQTESWVPSSPVLSTPSLLSPVSVVPLPPTSLIEEDLDPHPEKDKDWSPLSE
uniref:THAP-type domain-containing protein n=1 Tax=Ixodes ricinus TaxID=34613 RepID=A0A6B0V5D0_IXORI